MKIDKEKLMTIAILVIMAALLYSVFVSPQGRQLKAIRSQYISGKELLKAREAKREELETLRERNQAWKDKLVTVKNRFLNEDEINSFLKNLTRLAEGTKNKLKTVDPLERDLPPELGIERMFVKITITGRYNSITDFLNMLTTNEKLLSITGVKIEREKGESQDLKATFVLTLFIIEAES